MFRDDTELNQVIHKICKKKQIVFNSFEVNETDGDAIEFHILCKSGT